jgi:hypothetical protein
VTFWARNSRSAKLHCGGVARVIGKSPEALP